MKYYVLLFFVGLFISCTENNPPPSEELLTGIEYNPIPFDIEYPAYTQLIDNREVIIPEMPIPVDNPLTEDGVELGRHLFYDNILSSNNTMSCASCHLPEGAFTDNLAVSPGVDGIFGNRSSMSLFNVGFFDNGLFWDGRSTTLEEQALLPVEDEIELHNSWEAVIPKLQESDLYKKLFRKAFGIEKPSEINKTLAAKAIAQFERSIYSFDSKFDQYLKGEVFLSDDELYGFEMYIDAPGVTDAQCAHCHNLPLMTSNDYFNNGLQEANTINDFLDNGLGNVTIAAENGFFRAPSLRNIELSGPYMHNGSLQTLEEVIDHYASGGKFSPSKDPLLDDINLNAYDKFALKQFLLTLTDRTIINEERLQSPF
ncbi:MAG: cytochrome c peroxidase [Saprospiraceae bacterium]|nr:cytochrome c peroxidase [Saprospiraceae bacterium]